MAKETPTRIDDSLSIKGQNLCIDGYDCTDLVKEFGTPLFVLSEAHLRRNYQRIEKAFSDRWPEGTVGILPAFKAAPYIAVRRILSNEGAGCDAFGAGELHGALKGNTDPARISVNGSIKQRDIIRRAIELGARIVIDAPRELELCEEEAERLGKAARVLFRLKPYLEGVDTESDFAPVPISELTQRVRYGMPTNEVAPLGKKLRSLNHIELDGFHCHMGRQTINLDVWESYARCTVELIAELRDQWGMAGWTPKVINLGGGFAPPRNFDTDHHRTGEGAPAIEQYAAAMTGAVRAALKKHGFDPNGLHLEFEPGRSLHSDTGVHLTKVDNIKSSSIGINHTWAEVDTSEQFLGTYAMDPSSPPFNFKIGNKANQPAETTLDIIGKSCGGEMILLDAEVPKLAVGDIVVFMDTGAYIESLSCNFNAMPRPGTILLRSDNKGVQWIRRPETVDEVFQRDEVPDNI